MNKFQRKIKKQFTANDSNMIIIKRSNHKDEFEETQIEDADKLYPIPYFEFANLSYIGMKNEDIYSDKTQSGLSNDFSIYVLDSQPGNYWEGLKPSDYMPEGWKNGYSKGFSINKKMGSVIYWLIIW